jgi:hypothetical protein
VRVNFTTELHDSEGSETGGGTDEFQGEEVTRIVDDDEAEPEHRFNKVFWCLYSTTAYYASS